MTQRVSIWQGLWVEKMSRHLGNVRGCPQTDTSTAWKSHKLLVRCSDLVAVYFVTRLRSCSALFLLPPGFLFPPRHLFVGRMTQNRWTETWMEDRYQTRIEVTELIQFVLLSLLPSFRPSTFYLKVLWDCIIQHLWVWPGSGCGLRVSLSCV